MKRLVLILMGLSTLVAGHAQDDCYKLRHDTLRIYSSWQTLMDDAPHTLLVNPVLTDAEQSNRLNISSAGGQSKMFVEANIKQSVAVVLITDSISCCYVNCAWLNRVMKNGARRLGHEGFLPIFFNGKMACVVLSETSYTTRWKQETMDITSLFHVDFEHNSIREINPKYLIGLLDRYSDLRLRYEGNRHRKDVDIIIDFLGEYMKRIEDDDDVPYIDELLNEK